MKEYQEEGNNWIKLVKSEENDADINTKNTSNTHDAKLVWEKDEITKRIHKHKYQYTGRMSKLFYGT